MDASELAGRLGVWSTDDGPLYRLLAAAIEQLIELGALRDGTRLPPERSLAGALSVSRGTVVAAYDELRSAGRVDRVQGSGTTVRSEPERFDPINHTRFGDALRDKPPTSIDLLMAVPRVLPRVVELLGDIDWAAHTSSLDDAEPAGIHPLRARIADRMTADGLATRPEEVLVTAGAQQGIDLVAQVLIRPGDAVLVEEVTWPGLSDTVRRLGGKPHGVTLDEDGLVPEALEAACDRLRPSVIGLNPHHQNPTGTRMPPHRRRRIAQIAADYGVTVIEDRVTSWLAFDGVIPPPLAVHQPTAPHVTIDSINKTAWPGFRLGWVRADAALISELRGARAATDLFTAIPSQLAALRVLDELDDIAAERARQLEDAATVLLTGLAERLPDWEVQAPKGGLVLWVRLPGVSATAFAQFANRYGVAVGTGREFSSSTIDDEHVRLPFTGPIPELREAVDRLAAAWAAFADADADRTATAPAAIV
ncbi:MAG: PLP-dependent aminotransferase family protein [Actinomycetota bacterium]